MAQSASERIDHGRVIPTVAQHSGNEAVSPRHKERTGGRIRLESAFLKIVFSIDCIIVISHACIVLLQKELYSDLK